MSSLATRMSKTTINVKEVKKIILHFSSSKRGEEEAEDTHQKLRELTKRQEEAKAEDIEYSVGYDLMMGLSFAENQSVEPLLPRGTIGSCRKCDGSYATANCETCDKLARRKEG